MCFAALIYRKIFPSCEAWTSVPPPLNAGPQRGNAADSNAVINLANDGKLNFKVPLINLKYKH